MRVSRKLLRSAIGKRNAFFFPGQGSEKPGMLSLISKLNPALAQDGLETLSKALANDEASDAFDEMHHLLTTTEPSSRDEKLIHRTSISQPLIMLSSILTLRMARRWSEQVKLGDTPGAAVLQNAIQSPNYMFGHSLGQIIAYVGAGVLSLTDGLKIVRERGLAMEDAAGDSISSLDSDAEPELGMISVPVTKVTVSEFVADFSSAKTTLTDAGELRPADIAEVALLNSPKQVVVSGHLAALEKILKTMNYRRTKKLPVRIPFHSSLLRSVEPRMRAAVDHPNIKYTWPPPHNVRLIDSPLVLIDSVEALKASIVEGCWEPVNWTGVVRCLHEQHGVSTWIGVGPGSSVSASLTKLTLADRDSTIIELDPMTGDGSAMDAITSE